ncbi:ROK family protein [Aestuariibius sp. 2305UL40-4]|uniref:ROK family protein n=1 Tax=Aestuariibius violaceus TaxID=3234132 RepID=UPI00345E3381
MSADRHQAPAGRSLGGIDVGGTKIAAYLFAPDGTIAWTETVPTPGEYGALRGVLTDVISRMRAEGGAGMPVGLGLPGRIDRATGAVRAANMPLNGEALATDLPDGVLLLNDVRAFALGEADGAGSLVALSIGTGVAAAALPSDAHSGAGGELGHLPLPSPLVSDRGLPLIACPCGRRGCYETLLAGPGFSRLAAHHGLGALSPEEAAKTDRVMEDWLAIAAQLLVLIQHSYDPREVVLGGSVARIPDLLPRLIAAFDAVRWYDLPAPSLRLSADPRLAAARGAARAAAEAFA